MGRRIAKLWKNYGLAIAVFVLFLVSWALQGISGYIVHVQGEEQVSYFWIFLGSTMENWQSEFFSVFVIVVFSTYLIYKDSPQSRDGDDTMRSQLQEILRIVKEILEILKGVLLRLNGRNP